MESLTGTWRTLLFVNDGKGYKRLNKEYPHGVIDHSRGQYVIGAIHTQTIEGFWSIFKRGHIPQNEPEIYATVCR